MPLSWRLGDAAEATREFLWPAPLAWATPAAFLLPAGLIVFILVVGMAVIVETSLHVFDYQAFVLKDEYTFANYLEIVGRSDYLKIIGRSLLGASIVTVLAVALAFPYAYAMVRTPSAIVRKLLLVGLFLPFFIGEVVRAYGWLIVLGNRGLLNSVLGWLGFEPWQLLYTYPAVIIGLMQYMLPFAILMLAPALTAIPEEIEMASEGLGAGWLATIRHVVLPMAKPGLVAATTVVFTIALTNYTMPDILGGGTHDFVANTIYDAFLHINAPGLGAALSVVVVLIGSILVGGLFALMGVGTLSFLRRKTT
ncbi:MAG: ABC transporter permease [Geminicoccaceae bacterium]